MNDTEVMTAMEVYAFMHGKKLHPIFDNDDHLKSFIIACSYNGYMYTSRRDDGVVRAVMFGWPIPTMMAKNYDGDPDAADTGCGHAFYSALVVTNAEVKPSERTEAILGMRDLVRLRYGKDFKLLCYHRLAEDEAYKVTRF